MGFPRDFFSGNVRHLSLGHPEIITIDDGDLAIPEGESSYIECVSESSTSDQIDTITKVGVQRGDILVLSAAAGHTITVDDANIDLGNSTRALVGVGQFLTLIYNGAGWSELAFCAGDNS